MFPGKLPNAPPAKLLAWLNLSHLEKATVFVTVRINAITTGCQLCVAKGSLLVYPFSKEDVPTICYNPNQTQ